jgi:hypothetical protein
MARSLEKFGTCTGAGLALAVGETVGGGVGRTERVARGVVGAPGSASGAEDDEVHPHVISAPAAVAAAYRLIPRP